MARTPKKGGATAVERRSPGQLARERFEALFDRRDFAAARSYWTDQSIDHFLPLGLDVRGGVERLTETGAAFADGQTPRELPFDVVILATGFSPALALLGQLIRLDAKGFALRNDRVTSADHDGLYFVGHNYDATGGLFNIARDAPLVAERIAGRGTRQPP